MRCAAAAMLLLGCAREPVTLLCMNANCVPGADVARDNTLEALRESLALEWEGRAAFDGIEIDTVWDAARSRCLFTYLYDTADGAADARDAAAEIATFLRGSRDPTRFFLKIQAKYRVAPDGRDPTSEELAAHTTCDLELAGLVEAAAEEAGRETTVIFGEEPAEQAALAAHPGWTDGDERHRRLLMFKAFEMPIPPARVRAVALAADEAARLGNASASELKREGVLVQLWTRHLTPVAMEAFDAVQPDILDTNDILTARLWLGPSR